jgi:hypothetical protein
LKTDSTISRRLRTDSTISRRLKTDSRMIVEHEPRLHDLKTVKDRLGHDREACASIPRFE